MTIASFVQHTSYVVNSLDDSNWNERCTQYVPDQRCSVGAHLAHHYRLSLFDWREKMPEYSFEQIYETRGPSDPDAAIGAISRDIGCTSWQVDLLLYAAGAPRKPFGFDIWTLRLLGSDKTRDSRYVWKRHARDVWANFAKIETLPPIASPDMEREKWAKEHRTRFMINDYD